MGAALLPKLPPSFPEQVRPLSAVTQISWFSSTICIGIPQLDAALGGIPRGALTEICGPPSSGRSTLLDSVLAKASAEGEFCALVDACDAFDPDSAAAAGVVLDQLLWVRCGRNVEHALKAADLVLHAGGFGVVALDLCEVAPRDVRRIPLSCWYRFRRVVEGTSTAFLVLEQETYARQCASLSLEMSRGKEIWSGTPACSQLLRGFEVRWAPRKPTRSVTGYFDARLVG